MDNVLLIPRFAFSLSALERRKPLSSSAERAGWVGCNIVLSRIPSDARIPLVVEGCVSDPKAVRQQYARLLPLAQFEHQKRGWTLDVLNVVRSLGQRAFSLGDVYAFEEDLKTLHPDNRHIREKIRQQLQVLRDLGLVQFAGRGQYRLRPSSV